MGYGICECPTSGEPFAWAITNAIKSGIFEKINDAATAHLFCITLDSLYPHEIMSTATHGGL